MTGSPPRLRLSSIDRAILSALDRRSWRRPIDIIRPIRSWIAVLETYSDIFLPLRLREWALHRAGDPAVLCREAPGGSSFFARFAFRLGPGGARLLDEGLGSPGDAPPLHAGGCELYRGRDAPVIRGRHLARWSGRPGRGRE